MRSLLLTRGAPGSGKSTWIRENAFEDYSINADKIRLLIQSPVVNLDGSISISQANDNKVWDLIFEILESRMERGEFTVLDATHSRVQLINRYKDLAHRYRYRVFVKEFIETEEELLRRNLYRDELTQVPELVIKNAVKRIELQKTPNWVTVINKGHELDLKIFDFSQYKTIHHFGDIHGCYEPLKEYFDKFPYNEEDFYIFTGDYFDRGIQNVEVLEFLFSLLGKKNVYFLEGNHEIHLWNFANGDKINSPEFDKVTKPQLLNSGINLGIAREFYRKLGQLAYYKYHDKIIFVNHAGYPIIPYIATPTRYFTHGVGKYEDILEIENAWNENSPENYYQIHGHRNITNEPFLNGRVYNLCEKIEFGGNFRALQLDVNGFHEIEIKNNVFKEDAVIEIQEDERSIIEKLRASRNIKETIINDHISSFNFTRDVFQRGKWNELTLKARGLFLNTNTGDIVARGYEKFFNLDEVEQTKIYNLKKNLVFPVKAYLKINGYLGILSLDGDELLFLTKASGKGDHVQWFKEIFDKVFPRETQIKAIKDILKQNEISLLCEIVDPFNDPHIIKYQKESIHLLDGIYNESEFRKMNINYLFPKIWNEKESNYYLRVKELSRIFNNWDQLSYFINECAMYDFGNGQIEGFVFEDQNNFMFKVKTEYYKTWKHFRSLKDSIARGRTINTAMFYTPLQNQIYSYFLTLDKETLRNKNIIELRDMFEEKVQ